MAKAWFITGASGGLGRELAEVARSEGDTVTAAVRRPEALRNLEDNNAGGGLVGATEEMPGRHEPA